MPATSATVRELLKTLEKIGTKRNADGMARFGIVAEKVFGVSVADIRAIAKNHRQDHELALALWDTGWYEARLLSAFVDDPAKVTSAQMDRQARDFDNWAICDTACFHLYDKTPYAWVKISKWAKSKDEFVKRAAIDLAARLSESENRAERWVGKDALKDLTKK